MGLSFVKVYFDFEERTEMLNEVEQGRLLLTMLRYAQGKTLPELKGNERFLFPVFKADIDRDAAAYATKVENGAKGGRPSNPNKTENNLKKPNKTEDNRILKNKTKEQEQEKDQEQDKEDTVCARFVDFWKIYPNKVKKSAAITAWKSGKCEKIADTIIADVQRRSDTEWKGDGAQYVPHPTTYLHQRRWEDETAPKERQPVGHSQGWHNPALDYAQRDYSGTKPKPERVYMTFDEEG